MDKTLGPATFGHLRENRQWLHLYCMACGYEREVDTTTPPWSGMPDGTVVPTLGKRMRCTKCNVKGKIWSVPELPGAGEVREKWRGGA